MMTTDQEGGGGVWLAFNETESVLFSNWFINIYL